MKKNKKELILFIIVTALAVLINGYIIMHSCFNASMSSSSSGRVVNLLKAIINVFHKDTINENNIGTFSHIVRKLIGHFGLFAVSGLFTTWFLYLLLKKHPLFRVDAFPFATLFIGLFLASLTEFIQLFVPGRSGESKDVLIDFLGYCLGFLIIFIIVLIIRRKNHRSVAKYK